MKNMVIPTTLMVLLVTLVTTTGLAAGGASSGGTFLPLGWSARGAGLAGAASIIIRDDRSGYWNPANLTFMSDPRATVGSTKLVRGLDNYYNVISVGGSFFDRVTGPADQTPVRRFGAALTITNLWLKLAQGSRWNESTIGFSGAVAINRYNTFGMTYRILTSWSDLEDANTFGWALDLGWTSIVYRDLWFSIMSRNTLNNVGYENRDEEIDPTLHFAAAYERLFGRASVECDLVFKGSEVNRFLVGTEVIIYPDFLYILGGADLRLTEGERTILTTGFGVIYSGFEIALGFIFDPQDEFGTQTRISLAYEF